MHHHGAPITTHPDRALAYVAAAQAGVVSREQLLACGISRGAIDRRVQTGRLLRVHAGVYAVGHRVLTQAGWWWAAVLAGGRGAVLSHRSAAVAHGLVRTDGSRVHVTSPTQAGRGARGVVHHRGALRPSDWTRHDGLAVTTVARTLLDVADREPRRRLEACLDGALLQQVYDHRALERAISAAPGRPGAARLAAAIAVLADEPAAFRSETERVARDGLMNRGLPWAEINAWLQLPDVGYEIDLLWRGAGLAVELDGPEHAAPFARARDARRDARLMTSGLRVRRFDVRRVDHDLDGLADEIRLALGQRVVIGASL